MEENALVEKKIKEVWADNLEEEFDSICRIWEEYPYISMDTEFPGVVARPVGSFNDKNYQHIRCNVDLLKIIQIGITFSDEKGNIPEGVSTWQFNFKFNLDEDMYAEDSINLLKVSGIEFEQLSNRGILVDDFAELLMMSGLVLSDTVNWISFHSGYDFGYLLKILSCTKLPETEEKFFDSIGSYFPNIIDVKYIMHCFNRKGGLNDIASELHCKRIGPMHQAGSDSLLTCSSFFKMKEQYEFEISQYTGQLYGLGYQQNTMPQFTYYGQSSPPPQGLYNVPQYQ